MATPTFGICAPLASLWPAQASPLMMASPLLRARTVRGDCRARRQAHGVWDAEAARTFLELSTGTTSVVSALLWSGDHLFVGDASGTISAFDLREATRPITELVAQACSKEGALSPRFTWLESASDPLIRELWDPEGTVRSVATHLCQSRGRSCKACPSNRLARKRLAKT